MDPLHPDYWTESLWHTSAFSQKGRGFKQWIWKKGGKGKDATWFIARQAHLAFRSRANDSKYKISDDLLKVGQQTSLWSKRPSSDTVPQFPALLCQPSLRTNPTESSDTPCLEKLWLFVALDHFQPRQLLLAPAASLHLHWKSRGKMEAFNEPLSAKASLPAASGCVKTRQQEWWHCQETVFTLPRCFQIRLGRSHIVFPVAFSVDIGHTCEILHCNQALLLKERHWEECIGPSSCNRMHSSLP